MIKPITIIVFNYANKYMYLLIQPHKVTSGPEEVGRGKTHTTEGKA